MANKKIVVESPIVVLDGDEMAQIIWTQIQDRLISPFVQAPWQHFDLGIMSRDATADKITHDAADALIKARVGIKCATITADKDRIREFGLKKAHPSPNGTLRNAVDGTVFREAIRVEAVRPYIPRWTNRIVIARHAHADQYKSQQLRVGAGKVRLVYEPADGGEPQSLLVNDFKGPGVAMGIFNLDASIEGFARACFNFGLSNNLPVFFATKHTILGTYDAAFRDIFQAVFDKEFADKFSAANLYYHYTLIDDVVARAIKSEGGFLWACKNYDGDVQSDMVAQAFGSLGMMSSVLLSPDERIVLTEAAHGTVTRHYRAHQRGEETSTNSVASIYAWSGGLRARGKFDGNAALVSFADHLEQACLDTINEGTMTKDLAACKLGVEVAPRNTWVTTEQYIAAVGKRLEGMLN